MLLVSNVPGIIVRLALALIGEKNINQRGKLLGGLSPPGAC